MKQILYTFIFSFLFSSISAQISLDGIVVEKFNSFETGDTVKVLGVFTPGNSIFPSIVKPPFSHYFYLGESRYQSVPKEKIILSEKKMDFWENLWFYHRGYETAKYRWSSMNVGAFKNFDNRFVADLQEQNQIMVDPFIEDYLGRLVKQIFPGELIRPTEKRVRVQVALTGKSEVLTFDQGLILISDGKLIELKNEAELIHLLVEEIAHLVLEHGYENHKNRTFTDPFYQFTLNQKILASEVAKDFFEYKKNEGHPLDTNDNPDSYTVKISSLIMTHAWEKWLKKNYQASMDQVDRLITANIATDETYVLKAMLYRQLYHTREANLTALSYLEKAEKLKVHHAIEIYREKGLLWLRLDEPEKALSAFEEYLAGLLQLGDSGKESKWTRDMIFKCKRMTQTIR